MNRREALTLIALAPFAASVAPAPRPAVPTPAHPRPDGAGRELKFFTAHEMATATVLADLILPADERSGSASQVGVPEFIDFMLADPHVGVQNQTAIRGGLAWLDQESKRRWGKTFVDAAEAERTAILDDIAHPGRVAPGMSHGASFFNRFRDMVASGFWSSEQGVKDLRYMGNTVVHRWDGCPPEALRKLGVSYGS